MANEDKGRIVIRPAQEDDYLGVMRISKWNFAGVDVVPALYFQYMNHPDKYPWVAVKDGKIVGFQMYYVTEDGLTLIGEAARRDPAVKGGNLMLRMRDRMLRDILNKYPRIQQTRGASIHTDWWDKIQSDDTGSSRPRTVMKRIFVEIATEEKLENILHSITPDAMANLSRQLPIGRIRDARRSDVEAIFQDKCTRETFFPEGVVVRSHEPFDASRNSTINTVIQGCQNIYITKYDDGSYESISFGIILQCPRGTMSAFDYYGSNNYKVILAHVVKSLSQVPRYYSGTTVMMHFLASTKLVDIEKSNEIQRFCQRVLNLKIARDFPFQIQYIIQNAIPARYKAKV